MVFADINKDKCVTALKLFELINEKCPNDSLNLSHPRLIRNSRANERTRVETDHLFPRKTRRLRCK